MVQYNLQLITRKVDDSVIRQRECDGYINATAMCKATGKEFKHYNENKTTKAFLAELSAEVGIPTSELIQIVSGGKPDLQGTWVHPQVAINLAQWCSPKFAVKVSQWVWDWMSGRGSTSNLPYHLRRYVANRKNVPVGHFSILTEMTQLLIAPMEEEGYRLPQELWPDISNGKLFCKWLREEHGIDTDSLPTYAQRIEDGRIVFPKCYPERLLAPWRKHFREVWMIKRAQPYFQDRDPNALPYLDKVLDKLLGPPKKKIA